MTTESRPRRLSSTFLQWNLFFVVVLVGCSKHSKETDVTGTNGNSLATTALHSESEVKAPQRVLVTGQGAAELMIALGKADSIVGMYYGMQYPAPAEVEAQLANIKAISENGPPSVEVVLALQPDFVLAQFPTADLDPSRGGASKADLESHGAVVFPYAATSGNPKDSTFDQFLEDVERLGEIFDVKEKAQQLVSDSHARLLYVRQAVSGRKHLKAAIVFSASDQGLGVFGAGMLNDLLDCAAVSNVYAGHPDSLLNISREDFATQLIDVYILPDLHIPGRSAEESFAWLKQNFPEVPASKSDRFVAIGVEKLNVGLRNVEAVEQIARVVHGVELPERK